MQNKHKLTKDVERLQQSIISNGRIVSLAQVEQILQLQINERDCQEEILWKQKFRIRWLKEGEKNIKFFDRSMVQCRHHNHISSIKSNQGQRLTEHQDMKRELVTHFQTLLTEPQQNKNPAINNIL